MAHSPERFALRGRWVFPVDRPPLKNGLITIERDHITAVGENLSGSAAHDLGDVAILPGLVNAHAHLEFSDLDKPIGRAGMPFVDWISQVVTWRRQAIEQSGAPPERAVRRAVRAGFQQSLAAGVTTIGEITTLDWTESQWRNVPLNGVVFRELIAPTAERVADQKTVARQFVTSIPEGPGPLRAGLSPHAPYTVRWELLTDLCDLAQAWQMPVAMHLAESPEELEWLQSGSGPMRDCLQSLQAWDESGNIARHRLTDYLQMLSGVGKSLVIHGNYLAPASWLWLGRHRDHMAVVYCPRTHKYFGHPRYPLSEMIQAGVRIAIATDSRASSPNLNLLDDLRLAARIHTDVAPGIILQAGTLQAAKALGCGRRVGSLAVGKQADLTVVAIDPNACADPWDALLGSDAPIRMTFRRGRTVYPPD